MESIFNRETNQKLIDRINSVTNETKPLWGKMDAAKMMAHCSVGVKIATGELVLKRNIIGLLFGRMAKVVLTNDKPFRKGTMTAKEFIIPDGRNFEEEKTILINYIKRFAEQGESVLRKDPHPFFGKLNTREWDGLMYKHLDHHLRQFGV